MSKSEINLFFYTLNVMCMAIVFSELELNDYLKGKYAVSFRSSKHYRCVVIFLKVYPLSPLPGLAYSMSASVISDISLNMFLTSARLYAVCVAKG